MRPRQARDAALLEPSRSRQRRSPPLKIIGRCGWGCGLGRDAAGGPSAMNASTSFEIAPPPMRLSGLEPVTLRPGDLFVNIGERTNVTEIGRAHV